MKTKANVLLRARAAGRVDGAADPRDRTGGGAGPRRRGRSADLYNLAETKMAEARFAEAEDLLARGLELAHERGDRQRERSLTAQALMAQIALGRWDEALAPADGLRARAAATSGTLQAVVFTAVHPRGPRGRSRGARGLLEPLEREQRVGRDDAMVAGRPRDHPARQPVGRRRRSPTRSGAVAVRDRQSLSHAPLEFGEAAECAIAADEPDAVRELLARVDALKPVQLIPMLDAEAMRARAQLAAYEGDVETAERSGSGARSTCSVNWRRRSTWPARSPVRRAAGARADEACAQPRRSRGGDLRRRSAPPPGWRGPARWQARSLRDRLRHLRRRGRRPASASAASAARPWPAPARAAARRTRPSTASVGPAAARLRASGGSGAARRGRRCRSGGWCRCCSRIWWGSRRCRSIAIPRRSASC